MTVLIWRRERPRRVQWSQLTLLAAEDVLSVVHNTRLDRNFVNVSPHFAAGVLTI